jgi:hypothetical protein
MRGQSRHAGFDPLDGRVRCLSLCGTEVNIVDISDSVEEGEKKLSRCRGVGIKHLAADKDRLIDFQLEPWTV